MKRGASSVPKSKLDQIKSGGKTKKQVGGVKESKNVIHGKGGKYTITETEKKFEESGVSRKKRNYVMYEAKLGTEKEQGLTKLHSAPKPRKNEQIVQTRKKVEYLDNYQYHETKDIKDKDPNKVSVVTHRRLGDIVGGYEVSTYQRKTVTDSGKGPKLYSSQTTTTTTRKNAPTQPAKTVTKKTTTTTTKTSRTLPAQSRDQRKEVKKTTTTNTNLKTVPKKPAAPLAQAPSRRSKPSANPTKPTTTAKTTKTTTTKTTTTTTRTRTQSAGSGRRKH